MQFNWLHTYLPVSLYCFQVQILFCRFLPRLTFSITLKKLVSHIRHVQFLTKLSVLYSSVIKAPKYRKESWRANQYQFETDICHNQRLHCVHTSHFVLNCSIRKAAKHVRCAELPWEIKTPVYADTHSNLFSEVWSITMQTVSGCNISNLRGSFLEY